MAGDDAFGSLVARELRTMVPCGMEVVDLGMKPAALLDYLADRTAVCIVDAAIDERLPTGTLIEVDFCDPDRPRLAHDRVLSSHGLSVADQLELASRLDLLPDDIRLVAVVIRSADRGCLPDIEVASQVPAAAGRIVQWAEQLHRSTGDLGRPEGQYCRQAAQSLLEDRSEDLKP